MHQIARLRTPCEFPDNTHRLKGLSGFLSHTGGSVSRDTPAALLDAQDNDCDVIVSKIRGLKSITFVHGLDLIVRNSFYPLIFIPFIRRPDIVVVNSHNTAKLAEQISQLAIADG
jgi:hypothetical protein